MSAEEKLCLATLVLAFQVLETNTAALTYVELSVSECVELHQDVLAFENIHISDNEFLLSGNQVKDIKSELIKYKEEIEARDNYLNLSMCLGLTMTVIDDVCLACSRHSDSGERYEVKRGAKK